MIQRNLPGKPAALALLPILILALSGFTTATAPHNTGYATGRGTNGSNALRIVLTCSTPKLSNGHGCTGKGQGFLGGKYFAVTDIPTDNDPTALTCPTNRCDGGRILASGFGWLGSDQVAFSFCGYDADPARSDTMTIIIYGPPVVAAADRFAPETTSPFGPTCGVASFSSAIGTSVLFGIAYTFTCANECFDFIRSNH